MSDESSSPPGSGSSFNDEMAQYLRVYIDESEEELEGLVDAILKLEENPQHAESLHKAFRMLHSLKGSSGMLGFEVAGNFAHELEDRFERYRSGQAVLDRATTTLVLQCVDYFREFLARLRAGDLVEGDPAPLLNQLRELERGGAAPPTPPPSQTPAAPSPPAAMTISGGLKIVIRFRPGLQLADLKARLIVSRLSSIGEIVACDPPLDDAHSFDELPLFSLTLVTDRSVQDVRKIVKVDGVDSVEILGRELTAALLGAGAPAAEAEPALPAPVDPPAAESAVVAHGRAPAARPSAPVAPAPAAAAPAAPVADPEAAEAKPQASETLRVEVGRLDDLMNLTGELVVANARFTQITGELSPLLRSSDFRRSGALTERLRQRFDALRQLLAASPESADAWGPLTQGLDEDLAGLERQAELWSAGRRHFAGISEAVDQLTRVSKNLQRGVLKTRMVPVGPLFNRFKRVVRDVSVDRGKQVQLVIKGEKTELDKRMIDALGDPLLHLVRNSIDHGLEPPEQRRAAGKPETGTITLEAAHLGNSVWITVRDDGAGISVERVRRRIVERGLAAPAEAQAMPEAEVIGHIWHPGFSTAEAVTEISGRGVGMDIVRNAISELSGTIEVASTPAAGTTFTIRLPLTLAIIHSLMLKYRDDYFSIPLDDVREIVSIPRDQVYAVHRHVAIDVRGELIPLVSMHGVFQWAASPTPATDAATARGNVNVVIIHAAGKTLGLTVDSLVGRSDLLIKSLAENFQPVRGLSGASILGDGTVCLMLDPAALVELAAERAQTGRSGRAASV